MKIVTLVARILFGLMFTVFGLNGILHFIPGSEKELPGLAGQFAGAMMKSHYMEAVAVIEVVAGVLLLINRYVPLGLVLLGPVVVNILLFHAFLMPANIAPAVVAALLWFVVAYSRRSDLAGIFQA